MTEARRYTEYQGLSPFCWDALAYGFFGFSEHVDFHWDSENSDAQAMCEMSNWLWKLVQTMPRRSMNLTEESVITLRQMALQGSLFTALNSPIIQVSARHRGTTPFEHTINVPRTVVFTRRMKAEERFLTLFIAMYHDAGKCMAVNMTENADDLRALMWWHSVQSLDENETVDKSKAHTDSYRDHQYVSKLVVAKLLELLSCRTDYKDSAALESLRRNQAMIELIIESHHLHGELFRIQSKTVQQKRIKSFADRVKACVEGSQLKAFMRIFGAVCKADLLSVKHYNNDTWLAFITQVNQDISSHLF